MSTPTTTEYLTASAAAYTLTQSGGLVVPTDWTVVAHSDSSYQSDGFSAVALKDPSGNIIIANEGTVTGVSSYDLGTLGADANIAGGNTPTALVDAQQFAAQVSDAADGAPIYVTGHSLGGTEAQAECQFLGSDCAGGATVGATGLPGNTSAGSSDLVNYVAYGDPVGNYASDASSPLSSVVPAGMDHFGAVVMTGNPSNATSLQTAASDVSNSITDPDSGANYGIGQSASQSLAAMSVVVDNLQYHYLSSYGSDLGIPISVPAAASLPDSTITAIDMALYGLPFGGADLTPYLVPF